MGHRHVFNTPQIFETGNDQRWNQAEQTFIPVVRTGAPESNHLNHSLPNTPVQGGHYPSHWNHAPSSSGYSSSNQNGELPVLQPQAPGPSHDPFLSHPAAVNFPVFPDGYSHYPSSSNLGGQPIPVPDGGFYDQTMDNFRRTYKRKIPGYPPVCEQGSTSRCYDAGSSSNLHLPSDPWQEKHNTESHHAPHEYLPSYRAHNLSIGNEGMLRNVRSRAAVDPEANMPRTNSSSNPLHHPFSSRSSDPSNSADFWGQSHNPPTRELGQNFMSGEHGLTSSADLSFFSHGPNAVNNQSSQPSGSLENNGCRYDHTSNRNLAPQNVIGNSNQAGRVVRSGYGPRTIPTFRASSSNHHRGFVASSDEALTEVTGRYPARDPRPLSSMRWRHIDRNVRNLPSSDRFRSFTEDAIVRDRLTHEGVMLESIYGSRTLYDQHRDMRLDIDNMSYEDLLALGERIGHVNTGLSDGFISKCLTESIYCSSDLCQDEGMCVICLEEYKNMDDVGTLKVCRHDFHVSCIRKWLSIKNACPICKTAAMDESKEK